ncbi:MAG TPA: hypothetical protein VJ647_03620, partial [Chitinophagaceae bacterium]|nr:hypothetical protein [Chitinophagaceae bacterium]
MKGNLFLLLLLLPALTGSAQNASFDKALSELHGRYITENVYLHLDKGICIAGDTLWFKGYVLEGNLLSGNSTSLHVELFDKTGYLILMKVFPLYDGITVGQLEIPANLTADVYYIRAYTKWQCNFDTRRLYQAPITVIDSKTNNATVLNRIYRNNNFSVTSGDDITLTSSNTPKGLHCTISCTETSPYIDSTLQLYFIGAGVTGKTNFTLSREKLVKSALMPLAPELAGHEMDMILLSSSGRVILQDKVFFNAAGIAVDILTDTISIAGKGLNSWRIRIKDTVSTLSVTVTDAEIDTNRISINNSISSTVLNYQDLIGGRFPDVNLVDSNYIRCRGVAQRISGRQPIRNKQLLAFITTKDSATSFEMIPIDSSGRFDLKNLFFY